MKLLADRRLSVALCVVAIVLQIAAITLGQPWWLRLVEALTVALLAFGLGQQYELWQYRRALDRVESLHLSVQVRKGEDGLTALVSAGERSTVLRLPDGYDPRDDNGEHLQEMVYEWLSEQ